MGQLRQLRIGAAAIFLNKSNFAETAINLEIELKVQ